MSSAQTRQLTVWVVDDDQSIRWVLERALSNAAIAVRSFVGGAELLDAIEHRAPDVLLTDIRMPGISGLDQLERVRAIQPDLPIIIMTAHSDLDSAVAAYEAARSNICPSPSISTRRSNWLLAPRDSPVKRNRPPANPTPANRSSSAKRPRFRRCSGPSADLPTRLLRVLQDGQFYRVGGYATVTVDVRIIAATHQDLEAEVKKQRFREDLYHRLNVIRLRVPPLRERREDIGLLLTFFLGRAARELQMEAKTLADAARDRLAALEWPGNVRQRENLCRWPTVMAPSREVVLDDLPQELRSGESIADHLCTGKKTPVTMTQVAARGWEQQLADWARSRLAASADHLLDEAVPGLERVMIRAALEATDGHRQEAARLLGWGRNR